MGMDLPAQSGVPGQWLRIRGARHHNLKGIDLDLPLGQIIVLTGPSGSGKSTLALDVLYAEGRHRYLDSLAIEVRRFLHLWDRPDVEAIEGIPPAIALEQRPPTRNPRSTVATLTDVADLLRLFFATSGRPYCPVCAVEIKALTIDQMADRLIALPPGTQLTLLAPLKHALAATPAEAVLSGLRKDGFRRIKVEGSLMTLDEPVRLGSAPIKDLQVVVDRLVVRPGLLPRLTDSLGLALREGGNSVVVDATSQGGPGQSISWTFSERLRCPSCGLSFPALSPQLFSRGHPAGRCLTCQGSQRQGSQAGCTACNGTGLNAFARNVRLGDWTLPQVLRLSIEQAHRDLAALTNAREAEAHLLPLLPAAQRIAEELHRRLAPMEAMGLGYLTLDRPSAGLSGGEIQRLRLAGQLGRHMTGVLYILDEPTAGLHPREQEGLWTLLEALKSAGNTILLVEHDLDIIRRADLVVELGPAGGARGGELVQVAPPYALAAGPRHMTGCYLEGSVRLERHRRCKPTGLMTLKGVRQYNIQDLTVTLPMGCLVCVTGVSGAGKSTLLDIVHQTLRDYLRSTQHGVPVSVPAWEGPYRPKGVLMVDQTPLSRSGLSSPATYMEVFTPIRTLFSRTPEARQRGYGPGHFSLTRKGGRCERCQGAGSLVIDLHFLPAVTVPCDMCHGRRYSRDLLLVKYRGHSIADVLAMTVQEAAAFFSRLPSIRRPLEVMERIAMGYLKLGQATSTLSGGECQRLKLARELARSIEGPTVYLLDEPSRGLHQSDLQHLFAVLDELLAGGHSVVIIEHQPEILALSDWIIELGPGGGPEGGRIIAEGPPDEVARTDSPTAPYLRQALCADRHPLSKGGPAAAGVP